MKLSREQAIEWWNNHSKLQQTQYCDTNTEIVGNIRRRETLTGREIELIWKTENPIQALPDEMININFEGIEEEHNPKSPDEEDMETLRDNLSQAFNKPQVDFEMLKETIRHLPFDLDNGCVSDDYINNLQLFFDMLSKSSSFAHKAHKKLNRLNK